MTDKKAKKTQTTPRPKVITEKRETSRKTANFSHSASTKPGSSKDVTSSTGPRSRK